MEAFLLNKQVTGCAEATLRNYLLGQHRPDLRLPSPRRADQAEVLHLRVARQPCMAVQSQPGSHRIAVELLLQGEDLALQLFTVAPRVARQPHPCSADVFALRILDFGVPTLCLERYDLVTPETPFCDTRNLP